MTRKVFDRELDILHREITALGGRVEGIIVDTAEALKTNNRDLAQRIYSEDPEITHPQSNRANVRQFDCAQQPLARICVPSRRL